MIRRQHLGQSEGDGTTSEFKASGLRFYRTMFEPGHWVSTRVPERCSYQDWESAHVQVTGQSHEVDGKLPSIGPGWMSRADPFVMEAGDYKRIFDTPAEYWCCLWGDTRSCGDVDSISIKAGQQFQLSPGRMMFVISGALLAADEVLEAPQFLKVKEVAWTLLAKTDVFAFTWAEN